jgi:hypothetical protein
VTPRVASWLKVIAMMIDPIIWPPAANLWLAEFEGEFNPHSDRHTCGPASPSKAKELAVTAAEMPR